MWLFLIQFLVSPLKRVCIQEWCVNHESSDTILNYQHPFFWFMFVLFMLVEPPRQNDVQPPAPSSSSSHAPPPSSSSRYRERRSRRTHRGGGTRDDRYRSGKNFNAWRHDLHIYSLHLSLRANVLLWHFCSTHARIHLCHLLSLTLGCFKGTS